ncbi:MAG: hypothetical protein ACI37S_05990 [Candidatus Gastranaerophilaceae bacterium]
MNTGLSKKIDKKSGFVMQKNIFTLKHFAFTIAEIIIVMGIIGVVAALTIPDLNNSAGNRANISRLKKIYAQLNEAQTRAVSVYGPIDEWFPSGYSGNMSTAYFDRITEFMKVQKSCRDAANNCASSEKIKLMNGDETVSYDDNGYIPQAVFADGTSIISLNFSYQYCNNVDDKSGSKDFCGQMNIDIDGPYKGKNTFGTDIFPLAITKQGIIPSDSAQYVSTHLERCTYYGSCVAWILEKNNMDYTLVNHDINEGGTYNCPNSKQLTWQNDSCD